MTPGCPLVPCPYCTAPCTCWTDHIGAARQPMQTGPYVCRACGAMEGGWDEDYGGAVFDRATGWLMPGTVSPGDRDFAAGISGAQQV